MGTAHSDILVQEYDEVPVKDQVHKRHKVLNEIKETTPLVRSTVVTEVKPPPPPPFKKQKKCKL